MDTSHRPHILLVDDDISAIQVLWCLLSDEARIRFAKSAAQALVLAHEQVPDLILLDFELPDGNGMELCRTLRQDPQLADVPVIIVTAHARDELQVSALEIGAADFISKPLQAAQLLARVRAQLRLRARAGSGSSPPLPSATTPPASPLGATDAAQVPPQAVRVLIVDDDVVAIKMLRNALEAMPVQFHFATRGEEALQLAGEVRPHIILLDAQLPGLDGFEVCRRLKADAQLADTPVIFVTRADDPLTEALALEAGAVDFIGKPYRPAVLKARVQHALQPRRPAVADGDAASAQHGVWQRWAAQRVQAVLDSQSDALLVFDSADHVEALNPAARALLGVETSDVQGLGPAALWRRIDRRSADLGTADAATASDPAALPAQPRQDEAWRLTRHDGQRLELRATLSGGGALTQAGVRTLRLQPAGLGGTATATVQALEGQAPTRLMTLAQLVQAMQAGAAELRRLAEALPTDPAAALARAAWRQERGLLHLADLVGLLSAQPATQWQVVDLPDCLRRAGWAEALIATLPADLPPLAGDPVRLIACLRRLLASLLGQDGETATGPALPPDADGPIALRAEIGPDRVTLRLNTPGWGWTSAELRRLRWPLPEQSGSPPAGGSAVGLAVTHHLLTELGAEIELTDAPAAPDGATAAAGPEFSFSLPRWDAQGPDAPLQVPA